MPLYKLLIRRSQPYLKVSWSPEFVLGVMNGMLKTAAEEYKAAIANNKFVELVEYQSSRGFVPAESLPKYCEQMSQKRPEDHKVIATLKELKTAWPSVAPPATPVKTPSEVYRLISEIATNSSFPMSGLKSSTAPSQFKPIAGRQ